MSIAQLIGNRHLTANIRRCLLVIFVASLLGACAKPLRPGERNYSYDLGEESTENTTIEFKDDHGAVLKSIPQQTRLLYEGICKGIGKVAKVDIGLRVVDDLDPQAAANCSGPPDLKYRTRKYNSEDARLALEYQNLLSQSSLGKTVSNATYYLSCWMTMAQIQKMQSQKVIFSDLTQ